MIFNQYLAYLWSAECHRQILTVKYVCDSKRRCRLYQSTRMAKRTEQNLFDAKLTSD